MLRELDGLMGEASKALASAKKDPTKDKNHLGYEHTKAKSEFWKNGCPKALGVMASKANSALETFLGNKSQAEKSDWVLSAEPAPQKASFELGNPHAFAEPSEGARTS